MGGGGYGTSKSDFLVSLNYSVVHNYKIACFTNKTNQTNVIFSELVQVKYKNIDT